MDTYRCNSCGATFQPLQAGGKVYQHVCPTTRVVKPAKFNRKGVETSPAVYEDFPNPRDERHVRGAVTINGKHFVSKPDPHDSMRMITTEIPSLIVSEGEGRTLLSK